MDEQPFGGHILQDPIAKIIPACSVNLLAGASGVGKTCFMAGLLKRFALRQDVFGYTPAEIPKIVYICADRGWDGAKDWLDRAGCPPIEHYSLVDDPKFNPKSLRRKADRVSVFNDCLNHFELPPGSMACVDTMSLFLGGNLNDYDTCAIACIEIRRICLERGLTIFGLTHASKQKSDTKEQYRRLQDRILGSMALLGYADTQMYLAAPDETGDDTYTFLWHPHQAKAEQFQLTRDENGLFLPQDPAAAAASKAPYATGTHDDLEPLLNLIPADEDGVSFKALIPQAEAISLSRATLHRYLLTLVQTGQVARPAHGRYRRCLPS